MDKETKAQYLDDPTYCPYCTEEILTFGDIEVEDSNTVMQKVECDACGKKWFDRFKLIDTIEIK